MTVRDTLLENQISFQEFDTPSGKYICAGHFDDWLKYNPESRIVQSNIAALRKMETPETNNIEDMPDGDVVIVSKDDGHAMALIKDSPDNMENPLVKVYMRAVTDYPVIDDEELSRLEEEDRRESASEYIGHVIIGIEMARFDEEPDFRGFGAEFTDRILEKVMDDGSFRDICDDIKSNSMLDGSACFDFHSRADDIKDVVMNAIYDLEQENERPKL